jgi:hypothetical protein
MHQKGRIHSSNFLFACHMADGEIMVNRIADDPGNQVGHTLPGRKGLGQPT